MVIKVNIPGALLMNIIFIFVIAAQQCFEHQERPGLRQLLHSMQFVNSTNGRPLQSSKSSQMRPACCPSCTKASQAVSIFGIARTVQDTKRFVSKLGC